ncbi:hypothetical protein CORC01_02749 [Colletotrichum orchidophilum]|uniref:Uncharacterized protein n=1 Tax=Colletotrichum orchidophilum TaxID=1209926 RepID=A0A1G4BKA0_9PEZI|nr:uncharacterized protein CORC01_02749 [Colletotrichum orchidophilum]OHF01871.1 hypothetical protein CORC01_02749 [Colletotrichum orchidophilum]
MTTRCPGVARCKSKPSSGTLLSTSTETFSSWKVMDPSQIISQRPSSHRDKATGPGIPLP